MVKRLVLLAAAIAGLALARKTRAGRPETDVWHEATTKPDLR